MKKLLFIILLFLSIIFCNCNAKPLPSYRAEFVKNVVIQAKNANRQIQKARAHLIKLYNKYINRKKLSESDINWLMRLAYNYKIKNPNFNKLDSWNQLEKRVDVLPISLIVAQAAYESNWGWSRFAQQGNNYFGQRCYRIGCGIIPKKRGVNEKFEVRKFSSLRLAIKSYIHNLNTFPHYRFLRELRAKQRAQRNNVLDGIQLAEGLEKYAEQSYYVDAIKNIILTNNLKQYDIVQ